MEDTMRLSEPEKGVIPIDKGSQAMGMLRDIAIKWFMETQAPLILQNGTLPEWFHGFITRKQAEDLLRDKPVGCFLIRLSDKAMGYILSYRGYNRCRHFVISQLQNRRYAISGDTCNHPTLTALISYYQGAKIEPFGETLTTACPQLEETSLYDAISLNVLLVTPPESTSPSQEKQEYLRLAKDRGAKTSPTPKPKTSFVHSKKSLEECPWNCSEEDNGLPREVPPLPERSSSLLMESFSSRHSGNIIYSELKKMNQNQQSPSMEASDIPSHLDPNKKSSLVPHCPALERSSPMPVSTSPGDRGFIASPLHHQARYSPASIGSIRGVALHAIPQSPGPNRPRDASPPGTHKLRPKANSSYSLEDQAQVSESHGYSSPIPGRSPKSAFLPLRATYNQLEGPGGWTGNAYEKIPGNQPMPASSLARNPYEQISKVQESKHQHSCKVEKPRRFFFLDRKNKQ